MTSPARAIGRGSAISICKTASGMVSAYCRRATSNSSSTLAPAWIADGRPIYGGFFWINGDGALPVPKDTYYMAGAGGQFTMIIPSHDLVVVRLGHSKGDAVGTQEFAKSLALLVAAIPAHH